MKKLIFLLLLTTTTLANAQWHPHSYGYRGYGWAGPAIVGGVIGYELAQPRYYQPSVVVVQQPPVVYTQPTTVMPPPAGYHYQNVTDPSCNCVKVALVPN